MTNTPRFRQEPHRPQFHFTPARHWINDPNGLIFFDGEYHLFYQYNPFGNQWGHMSWGHAVSADLVNWHELPVAIAEDERASIFSGSVVVDTHNSSGFGDGHTPPLVAIYTGCLRRPEGGQAQELAYSRDRGRTWVKYAANPVLDLGLRDFRDPKVFWHAPSARWVMAVVLPDDRKVQFYASATLKQWALLSEFEAPFEGQGIWECPDLIELPAAGGGTVWMLKVDAFGGHPSGGTGARIFFGHFDGTRFHAEPEAAPRWADLGADFYAALSWSNLAPPTWLAWMSCHRYAKLLPSEPWRGAMTVPRTLTARRGGGGEWQLLQQPVAALQALRVEAWALAAEADGEEAALPAPGSADLRTLELEVTVHPGSAQTCGLALLGEQGERCCVGYDTVGQVVFIDRSASGVQPEGDSLYGRRHELAWPFTPSAGAGGAAPAALRLRVLVDWSSVEVFVGDGEGSLTDLALYSSTFRRLAFFAEGGAARLQGRAWPLRAAQFSAARGAGEVLAAPPPGGL